MQEVWQKECVFPEGGEVDRHHCARREVGHTGILQHQGCDYLQQGGAATGEVCQGAPGLEVLVDYV